MENGSALRRAIHVLTGLGALYYFIPVHIFPAITKESAFVILIMLILAFESLRIQLSIKIVGMRPYEFSRLSGFAWAFMGMATVDLFFPFYIALPSLLTMALMDPLAGELRLRGMSSIAVVIWPLSFIIFETAFLLLHLPLTHSLYFSAVGSTVAWLSEHFKFRAIDDDYLMSVLPAVMVTVVRLIL
ncbi:MAG: hypothetical protein QXP70_04315 [Methanomassiliicoccales archaeon]